MTGVSIPAKKPPQSKISAVVVADSITVFGHRITTMALVMPRMILAEFNTHRVFSRNSASSRAIPLARMIDAVKNDPFIPIKFLKEHTGMQGYEYLEPDDEFWARKAWLVASEYAINQAKLLGERYKVSKQFANRLLEPFMWHKVLVTSTEWDNFFALRYNGSAEIHMQTLAMQMLIALNSSTPKLLQAGEWHIPYGDDINEVKMKEVSSAKLISANAIKVAIATSRAARISYTLPASSEKHDYVRDVDRHDNLAVDGHWSPLEHAAQAPGPLELCTSHSLKSIDIEDVKSYLQKYPKEGWWGNFYGWKQYRKTFPNENRSDHRLIKHNGK